MCQALVKEERFLYITTLPPAPLTHTQKKTVKDAENKSASHSTTTCAGIKFGNHRAPQKTHAGRKGGRWGREERASSRSQKFNRGRRSNTWGNSAVLKTSGLRYPLLSVNCIVIIMPAF